ncbi:MAG: AraC family transcriptional regulator [Pseudomonadota bacterium]
MSNAVSVAHGEFGRAAIYALDRPIVTHAHREGHLIFHVDGTPAQMTVGDQTFQSSKDTVIAVSPWEPHSFHNAPNGQSLNLVLYIKPMWFLENSSSAEFALSFGRSKIRVSPAIQQLANRLTTVLLHDDVSAKFDGLLFSLTRACFDRSWRSCESALMKNACARFNDYRVRRSLRVMQDNLTEEFEMEDLARSVGLSRPHFFKLFKQQMGVTPNIYMNTLRSEQAIEDLLSTDKSVTDIALDLGFSSQASFTRFFSSNVGIAPSEYRRVSHEAEVGFPMIGQ